MLICKYGCIDNCYGKYTLEGCNTFLHCVREVTDKIIVYSVIEIICVSVPYDGELVIPLIFDAIMEGKDVTREFILSFSSKFSVDTKLDIGDNKIVHEDDSYTNVHYLYREGYHFNFQFYITTPSSRTNLYIHNQNNKDKTITSRSIYLAIITYHDIITFIDGGDYNCVDDLISDIRETHNRISNGVRMIKSARK